jgi:DNA-binding GntR family transcriptional regulator
MINFNLSEKKVTRNSKEYAYRMIRENVLNLNIIPGTLISENSLAEALDMSRTPIREAISRLVLEEVLQVYSQRGTYVSKIDMNRVNEAVFTRSNLETAAVRLACKQFNDKDIYALESILNQQEFAYANGQLPEALKLDDQLHKYFFVGNHMLNVWSVIQTISSDYYRVRCLKVSTKFRWTETMMEHKQIVELIKKKDAEKAEAMLRSHIEYLYKDVEIVKERYPDYFK